MGGSFRDIVTVLFAKDTWLTNGIRSRLGADFHACNKTLGVHSLQIIKVEMRAATVPECEIKWQGAGSISRLGDDSVPIQIAYVVFINSGCKEHTASLCKFQVVSLNGNFVALLTSEMQE